MVKCPVCNKIFQDQFALNGHLRLTRDTEHIDFYQQKNDTINKKIIPLSTLSSTGVKTIDLLEKFIQQYEKNHVEEIKEDKFIEKLRKMIQEERKIDLDKERERMREEVMQQYQSDVANAVAKGKQELQQKYKEEIEAIRIKLKNENHEEYHKKYAIYLDCIYCHNSVLRTLNNPLVFGFYCFQP